MSFLRGWLRESRIFNFNQVERDRWIEQQAASVPSGATVLDMGAGSAPYRHLFQHCTYHTQDFAKLLPEQLRGKTGYQPLTYECDITKIPVEDGFYDAILCTEVIEHVPEPIKVLQEMRRILKPGGRIIMTAPLGSGIHQEPYHFYGGYTPFWYQKFLTDLGFDHICIESNGGFFRHYGQESIRFFRMAAPGRMFKGWFGKVLWTPVWLCSAAWFAVICPLLCYFIDSRDQDQGFTIGYHVLARKVVAE
jgi:ubiquinone/menaquinone biosynthesis C-methylase UbiE